MDNPLTLDDTLKLFSYLDVHIQHSPSGCDNTLRHAKDFLQRYGDEFAATVIEWLEGRGGFCDCEAILNVLLDYLPNGDGPDGGEPMPELPEPKPAPNTRRELPKAA